MVDDKPKFTLVVADSNAVDELRERADHRLGLLVTLIFTIIVGFAMGIDYLHLLTMPLSKSDRLILQLILFITLLLISNILKLRENVNTGYSEIQFYDDKLVLIHDYNYVQYIRAIEYKDIKLAQLFIKSVNKVSYLQLAIKVSKVVTDEYGVDSHGNVRRHIKSYMDKDADVYLGIGNTEQFNKIVENFKIYTGLELTIIDKRKAYEENKFLRRISIK